MRPSFLRTLLLTVPLAAALSGCSSSETFVAPTPTEVTESFSGTLIQGGEFYHAVVARSGSVITTMAAIGPDSSATVGMSAGVLNAVACTALGETPTAQVGSQLLATTTGTTTVCFRIYDNGTIATDTTRTYELTVKYTK
jgi:broad specificity phosphatase PhoE